MSNQSEHGGKAVQDFLAEAEEIIDRLSLDLVTLSDCADSGDCDPETVNAIFRGAHSLKGLAGMFGFGEIADLAHNMENLLDSLRLGKIPLAPSTAVVLMESMDVLSRLVRNAGGDGDDHVDVAGIIASINACATTPVSAAPVSPLAALGLDDKVLNALTEYEEHRLLENIKRGKNIYTVHASFSLTTFDQDLSAMTEALKRSGEVISTLPSVGGDFEAGIDFDILYGSPLSQQEVAALVVDFKSTVTRLGAGSVAGMPEACVPVAPEAILEDAAQPALQPASADELLITTKSMSRTVRVDIAKLDELMNIVGELVLSHSAIAMIAGRMQASGQGAAGTSLAKAAKELERKLAELQKGVMEIRMIPVGQLFEKMTRIVRKVSREQGKKVDLKTFGGETELDKLIIEDISDPLMHIIRNAIDHGIELPDDRLARGKAEKGTIRLSSFQKGNHVVIEIEDDGKGISVDRIRRKAVEKGLIPSPSAVTDREALDLIFMPGFSTAEAISEVSGRGVGMDVVRNNIASLSGMVDIETREGSGTKVIITLPITLAIIKALLISAAGRTYAIPITSVLETIMLNRQEIKTVERKEVIQLRESTLPLVRLAGFFGNEERAPEELYVVVVGVADRRLGIVVDELLGQQDIVIKSLGETLKTIKGIAGAADLGDQRTILVIDVGGVISEATKGM
jgi:two-component system chemotaxis sensor kinase CheA